MDRFVVLTLPLFVTIVGGCHDRDKSFAVPPASAVVLGQGSPRPVYYSPARTRVTSGILYGIPPRVQSDAWANGEFQRMNQLYEQFRYDECLEVAQVLIQYPNVSDRRRASIFVTQGAVLFLKGRYAEARQAFGRAHRLDPDFRINGRYFSPELVECFESSR